MFQKITKIRLGSVVVNIEEEPLQFLKYIFLQKEIQNIFAKILISII